MYYVEGPDKCAYCSCLWKQQRGQVFALKWMQSGHRNTGTSICFCLQGGTCCLYHLRFLYIICLDVNLGCDSLSYFISLFNHQCANFSSQCYIGAGCGFLVIIDFETDANNLQVDKATPLYVAAAAGQLSTLKCLLDHKADIMKSTLVGFAAHLLASNMCPWYNILGRMEQYTWSGKAEDQKMPDLKILLPREVISWYSAFDVRLDGHHCMLQLMRDTQRLLERFLNMHIRMACACTWR